MKFSEQWLREWVDHGLDSGRLAQCLTMAGLEVDAVTPVAPAFSGVVVAEVTACAPHPNADRLQVCTVNVGDGGGAGGGAVQIVCGAPNARAGMKAPLAQVGAVLPGGLKIKPAKLRGVESRGMLCAGSELGLSEDSAGLLELAEDAPVGANLREYLGLDDSIIDLDLTPNRADCLGLRGVAREVGLLTGCPVQPPAVAAPAETIPDTFPLAVSAPEGCPRYLGRVVRGVDISRPSPLWLRERLRRSGLRSIDCVVDVTNYVLLELGQPMHAFDLGKLQGGIDVRWARDGETLQLLDGQTVTLQPGSLLITDASGPIALAGIMGGKATAVSASTRDILFESAFFAPRAILGKARGYGLHTDSSHRYERGVDFQLQHEAMQRATQLLTDIAGGAVGPVVEVRGDTLPPPASVSLRRGRIRRILGFEMADGEVERILTDLGMGPQATDEGWQVAVPSWRFDIAIEADLLEELARVRGYNNLPAGHIDAPLTMSATPPAAPEGQLSLAQLRRRLTARDYHEAITYSFVDPKWQRAFDPGVAAVALHNPLSAEMSVMRTSLVPGLLQALVYNVHRQQPRVRLFETGLRFLPVAGSTQGLGDLEQRPSLAAVITGRRAREGWAEAGEGVDFFDIKGDLQALLALTGAEGSFRFVAGERAGLHPGQTAALYRNDHRDGHHNDHHNDALVGHVGALHPALQQAHDLAAPVYAFEVDLAALLRAPLPVHREVSKYPEQRRDLAVVVGKSVAAGELLGTVAAVAGDCLVDLRLFDVYEGEGIAPDSKSLALGLTFQDASRTLGDEDVNDIVERVVAALVETYNAELRS